MAETMNVINETPVFRRPRSQGLLDNLDGMRTVQEVFLRTISKFEDSPAVGTRELDDEGQHLGPYQWETWKQFAVQVGNFGRGLLKNFPQQRTEQEQEQEQEQQQNPPKNKNHKIEGEEFEKLVGLYSVNRVEWAIADMACVNYGFVAVPLYDTLGPTAVQKIIEETKLSVAVCSKNFTSKLIEIAKICPSLKLIIQMGDEITEDQMIFSSSTSTTQTTVDKIKIASFNHISNDGKLLISTNNEGNSNNSPDQQANILEGKVIRKPEDLHTIIYTSGTSGGAKGVKLTNGAFLSGIAGTIDHLRGVFIDGKESILSFLPLAHVLERQVFVIAMYFGAKTGYFNGHIRNLMNDLATLRPTVFFAVPRLFNKVYSGFQDKLRQKWFPMRFVFNAAYLWKSWEIGGVDQKSFSNPSYLDFAFKQLRQGLGGNVKMIITGSAPLSPEIHRWMQVCFGCPVLQGYGMTEGYPVSVTGLTDSEPLHCGPLMAHVEMKLRDVPELGYFVNDQPFPRGEALIRGPHLFSGYFHKPELTAKVMTSDGFYCTGDIVEVITGNRLRIIGRCKDVIKLAHGEFVVIEEIENMYSLNPLITQIFVYGDAMRDSLVAVVVPHMKMVLEWWKMINNNKTINPEDEKNEYLKACADPRAKEWIMEALLKSHQESGMSGITRISAVHIEPFPFTPDSGVVTPTTKLAREGAKKYYANVIEKLYSSLSRKTL